MTDDHKNKKEVEFKTQYFKHRKFNQESDGPLKKAPLSSFRASQQNMSTGGLQSAERSDRV